MKIIWSVLTFDNPKTGGEKAFARLAELLKSRGVTIVKTYRENKDRVGVLKKVTINFSNFRNLLRQDKQAPIFQNLCDYSGFLLANIFLYFFRRKIILFIHEIHEVDKLTQMQRCYRGLVRYIHFWSSSLIVVNSQFTGNWVCNFGNFKKKLFLMYPAIDLKVKNSKKSEKSKSAPINILCVGNIRRKKGQIYLLQAMESVQFDYKLNFVGLTKEKEEDYLDKLQEYIAEKGITDKVHFSGFLKDDKLTEAYQNADIFVLPSIMEEFGMVIFEAMSFGLPIVASKIGGTLEQVNDGHEGFLVPPRDPKALANKLDKLVTDPELRTGMGELGRERAAKLPTMDQVFEEFYQVVAGLSWKGRVPRLNRHSRFPKGKFNGVNIEHRAKGPTIHA